MIQKSLSSHHVLFARLVVRSDRSYSDRVLDSDTLCSVRSVLSPPRRLKLKDLLPASRRAMREGLGSEDAKKSSVEARLGVLCPVRLCATRQV